MEDLFRDFWWLLFPVAWFIIAGWQAWLGHLRRRDAQALVRDYAVRGEAPPAELSRLAYGKES